MVDFGYIGVFLGNVIYGICCVFIKNAVNRGNILEDCDWIVMIDAIFKAPRATFDAFFWIIFVF